MQRFAVPFVGFADVDAHQHALSFEFFMSHATLLNATPTASPPKICLPAEFPRSTTTIQPLRSHLHKLSREAIRHPPAFSRSPIQSSRKSCSRSEEHTSELQSRLHLVC